MKKINIMANYIFDREKDDFMKDDDGERIQFSSQSQCYTHLKGCGFDKKWVEENFFIMKSCKILIPENIPELEQSFKEYAEPKLFIVNQNTWDEFKLRIGDLTYQGIVGVDSIVTLVGQLEDQKL